MMTQWAICFVTSDGLDHQLCVHEETAGKAIAKALGHLVTEYLDKFFVWQVLAFDHIHISDLTEDVTGEPEDAALRMAKARGWVCG